MIGKRFDKHICRMHIFEMNPIGDVVDAITIFVIPKPFYCNHIVYLRLCSKAQTLNVWLCKKDTEKSVRVTRKPNDSHNSLELRLFSSCLGLFLGRLKHGNLR